MRIGSQNFTFSHSVFKLLWSSIAEELENYEAALLGIILQNLSRFRFKFDLPQVMWNLKCIKHKLHNLPTGSQKT